jgi:hypothetical protein
MQNPTLFGRPEGVQSQTVALQSTLCDLRAANSCLSNNLPDAFFATLRLLSDFSRQLSAYFDAAECKNYFNTIASECPTLERRARLLERAHQRLKASFASAGAPARGREKICTLSLATRIDVLLDDFERHELAEGELLQEFFRRSGEPSRRLPEA